MSAMQEKFAGKPADVLKAEAEKWLGKAVNFETEGKDGMAAKAFDMALAAENARLAT